LQFLVVDDPALAARVVIGGAESPPQMILGVVMQPCPQTGIGIGRRLGLGLAALGCSVLPGHPAGEPFTHAHHRDEAVHGRPPACRA
jgi:hypothetical protein